jgi:hypothetical protein
MQACAESAQSTEEKVGRVRDVALLDYRNGWILGPPSGRFLPSAGVGALFLDI